MTDAIQPNRPTLPTVELGDGLVTTVQGYGGMSLTDVYGEVDDDQATATLRHALDAGITFIDTADLYGAGRSERIIGALGPAVRERIQLASKFGIVAGGGVGHREVRGDRAYLRERIEGSLARLRTDHLDLYYQHRVDPRVPIEETVGFISELVDEGKVAHIGLSEATGAEIRRAAAVHPIAAVQSEWNIFARDVEAGVLPAVRDVGAGFVPYSPLSRGLLADGAARLDVARPNARGAFPRFWPEHLPANLALVETVRDVASEASAIAGATVTIAQVAIAWLYAKAEQLGVRISPIPGTRSATRVDENLAALGVQLTDAQIERLDGLAARVSGARSADPNWTSGGREAQGQ